MKMIPRILPLILAVTIAILQQGCTIKWEVVNDPYPNYHHIQQRIQLQLNQIDSSLQAGDLDRYMAQALDDNEEMVRQLAWQYQNSTQPSTDISPSQTAYLDSLLTNNGFAINDAIRRHQQWAQAFQGGWNYDYGSQGDRFLYIAYLNHRMEQQQAAVDDALRAGQITQPQAQDLKIRIQITRNVETNDYSQNGGLDLNQGQRDQLNQMVSDNDRYIRFRTQQGSGRWHGDRYDSWGDQRTAYQNNPSPALVANNGNSGPEANNSHRYWDGRSSGQNNAFPGATPWKPAIPTATPAPVVAMPTPKPPPSNPTTVQNHFAPPANVEQPSNPKTVSTTGPSTSQPAKPQVVYLPLDSLTARVKQQDQTLLQISKKHHLLPNQLMALSKKRNSFIQTLGGFTKQNHQNKVTQDQMNQLNNMLDDYDKLLAGVSGKK